MRLQSFKKQRGSLEKIVENNSGETGVIRKLNKAGMHFTQPTTSYPPYLNPVRR